MPYRIERNPNISILQYYLFSPSVSPAPAKVAKFRYHLNDRNFLTCSISTEFDSRAIPSYLNVNERPRNDQFHPLNYIYETYMQSEVFAGSSALNVPQDQRVAVNVNNLSVAVKPTDPELGGIKILDEISIELRPSSIMAIMGGSGAGKTTLLNVLAQRLNINHTTMEFSGSIDYRVTNTSHSGKISTAYMQQLDVFLPGLSLRETLEYQAQLRLANSTKYERDQLVLSLLELLEIDHRAKEIVKSFTGRINLSGGEQRRASLAIQLLSKPQLLFLDEPTTGLDTSSALKLVTVLRKLASPEIGMTIILLIHQPRSEIAALFDTMCVLARGGRLIFYGSLNESTEHFKELEKKAIVSDSDANDAFEMINKIMTMSVKNTSSEKKEAETSRVVDSMITEWKRTHVVHQTLSSADQKSHFAKNLKVFKPKNPLPLHREIAVLTKRTFLLSLRDKPSLLGLNGGSALMALILGWMFFKPTPNLSGIRSLTSALYTMLEVIGFSPLAMELERLWSHDGVFFFKEFQEQCVTIPGFIISRRLAKFVTEELPMSILFSVISYFMWGLRLGETYLDSNDGSYFAIFLAVTILTAVLSTSTAMMSFALGGDFQTSALIGNVFYQVQNSGCGYFVNAKTMPIYVRWVKYVAYFWYAFGALTSNQYTDWKGQCPYPDDDDRCLEYTGNYQLDILGFPRNWIAAPIGYLCIWIVGFNVLIWVLLKFRNCDVAVAKKKKNKIGGDDKVLERTVQSPSGSSSDEKEERNKNAVSINVKNVTLSVKVKESRGLFAPKVSRTLLNDISVNFKADCVNVIMGPSGGGKTSFLNFLASRLPRSSKFTRNGHIFLNGIQDVSPKEISRIAAYVTQDDNMLIPHLTVRETLYYQARLRLPENEHPAIPSYISYLLRQTGLTDCADTPVGSAVVKGISGGEKRRVSIAIQLLSRPKILFLDEPTSGLDTATSASIMILLKDLSRNGTTVVSTMHQPSHQIFCQFDTLTLLARGGLVIYNGAVSGLPGYLANLGHVCPPKANLADFALDLVSMQLTETADLFQSRVDYLIQCWENEQHKNENIVVCGNALDLSKYGGTTVSNWSAFLAVCGRQFKVSYRAKDVMVARTFQAIFLAAVYALFYAPLKNSQEGIGNRLGLTQNVINLYFCGLVNNIGLYPHERDLFHQEYQDGTYGVGVFTLAYTLVELPYEVIPSLIFSVLVVFGIGLPRTPGMFFAMVLSAVVSFNAGESLGIIFNSFITHLGLITNVLVNMFVIAIFMAGTMSLQMPKFFKAWNYINPVKYIVQICVNMGFENQHFSCPLGDCVMNTGADVLDMYGLKANLGSSFGALVACLVIYRAVGICFVYIRAKWFI